MMNRYSNNNTMCRYGDTTGEGLLISGMNLESKQTSQPFFDRRSSLNRTCKLKNQANLVSSYTGGNTPMNYTKRAIVTSGVGQWP